MWFNEVIELGTETQTVTNGEPISTMAWRTVYADKKSVLTREIEQGSLIGMKPEMKFEMYAFEYAGEKFVRVNNVIYTVVTSDTRGDKAWFTLSKAI